MNARPELLPADGRGAVERYVFPASFAQQRLWFLEQLDGAGPVWNTRLPVRLEGRLDPVALQAAVNDVVARHEALRTTFGLRHGEVVQSVRNVLDVPIERVTPAELVERTRHAFDLREGPLVRVFLASLGIDDHLLLVLSHHIVSDAWSAGVLFRDLAASYDARRQGRAPRLPELPVQYADFAAWQREWLAGPELERQLGYWRGHLKGAPALLELPIDRPRPRLQGYRGHRLGRVLAPALSTGLKALAAKEGATLFMVAFAAFNWLLSRWSGQQDLVIGTPIAGRRRTELEGVVGFFANTLALRTRVAGVGTFLELLQQVRADALRAYDHQDLPFEKLVEALKPVRNLAHSPVFQVMFVLQNAPWEAGRFGDLGVSPAELEPPGTARFDLTVTASEYDGQLWLGFEYDTDLFEQATIERLGAGFETLLAAIVAAPGAALAGLPVEAEADHRRQLVEWQPVPTPLPDATDVHDLFEAQARRTPDAIAVECAGIRLGYGALDARVAAIARQLLRAGCVDAGPVAICLPRSVDMLASVLAVLRIGGCYLPLDPGLPPARLKYLLDDSAARLAVTTAAQRPALADFAGAVVELADGSAMGDAAAGGPIDLPARNRDAGRPAYLIYTSGSTGQPKGVVVPQRAVVNFLQSMAGTPGLVATDRLLAVTTLSFDIAALELLLPLTVGATVVIATEGQVADATALADVIDSAAITVMQATPSAWRNLLAAGWTGRAGLRLLCGGEALDPALAAQLVGCGAELWNLYGPTETTIWSCVARIDAASLDGDARPPAIGRPIANTRCHVLDEAGRPVPIGAAGELWIGGAGVALGYHGQPALTDERFRPDPFAGDAAVDGGAGRMYRTGDRARWRNDGRLEILGRLDRQLKLRGYRIEPGEIEAALVAHPAISAAAVVLQSINNDPRLVAYLVPPQKLQTPVPDTELASSLAKTLPGWMVPAHFAWLDQLPLTPNGKLDRQALPPVAAGMPAVASAAMTGHEQAVARLFGELLGRVVGPDDDFFQCGGHSLLATRLIARIRAEFGATLPLRALFEAPTVRALATVLVAASAAARPGTAPAASAPATQPIDATAPIHTPLSLVQQRLWFLDRLQPGNSVYHLAWAFELRGPLDRTGLKAALDGLVARHDALRTSFPERDGIPGQRIEPTGEWPMQVASASPDGATQLLADAVTVPFVLATGPLIRALLVESGPDRHTLLLVVHHIVADGWSLGILCRELAVLYAAALAEPALPAPAIHPLPALGPRHADYATEQRRRLASGELQRQLAWWQAALKDAPPFLDLPIDRPRPLLATSRGSRLTRVLPTRRQAALHGLANATGCTFFMVVLAAMDVLLARCTGSDDIVVGTPIAGRPDRELESVVGFFVNTLVLRTRLTGNPTVRELLQRVREHTLAAYENADVPFELLVETLQPPRATNRTPVFQVLFNLHNEPGSPLELPGLEVRPAAVPRHTTKFDLGISLTETRDGLSITIEYNRDLFRPESIERFIADYDVVLAGFIATPDARLDALPRSAGAAPSPAAARIRNDAPTTLPAAFAEAVARTPGARAVRAPAVTGTSSTQPAVDWTYADLSREVAQVAAILGAHRVQPGDRIALWFGHGARQIAALLGVLEAGAVYVPLDPLSPAARLKRIIDDAGAVLVLTDRHAPAWPLPSTSDQVVVLPDDAAPAINAPTSPRPHDPDALAYLLYTSGSTGVPKGVPQTHRNVLHHVRGWAGNLGITSDDRLSLLSTCGYDAAVQDIFGALLNGAAVCPLDIRHLDREALLDRIADWGLTVLHGTPSAWRYLFGGHVACRQDLSRVRLVVLGGEPARRADLELFTARFGKNARFINGYGLTEATAVTQWFAGRETHPYGQQLPIGRPLHEGAVKLVDERGLPAAFTGELLLDAASLTPGYWSAARQGPAACDERWFRTGDLARLLPDGNLVFVGRRDERLKIGGIRVEPAEIEAALCSHPAVAEAAVLATTSPAGDPVLVACFELATAAAMPSPAALRSHLAALLPAALIPAQFRPVDRLPRRPNGKLDRTALRAGLAQAPAGAVTSPITESTLPAESATVAERQRILVEIWQALLQREPIGIDDDFFLLGGHSLLATRLVARIRDRLGIEVPLIRIFEAPTIRGLASSLTGSLASSLAPSLYNAG